MGRSKPQVRRRKHEKFRASARRRTNNVLRALRVLGNCGNKQTYHYTDDEVKQIFDAIEEELRVTQARFGIKRKIEFSLGGQHGEKCEAVQGDVSGDG